MSFKLNYNIPESQITEVNTLLLEYSMGNYKYQGKLSDKRDEIDTIIEAINVLGQELNSTTVSRDYFLNIFNASTNLVVVIDVDGKINAMNTAASEFLGQNTDSVREKFYLNNTSQVPFWEEAQKQIESFENINIELLDQKYVNDNPRFFNCKGSGIKNSYGEHEGYLLVLEEITERKEHHKALLKVGLKSQKQEQLRVAKDLHDSLGQQLSALSIIFSNLDRFLDKENQQAKDLYKNCTSLLNNSVSQLREICFNIMPSSLKEGDIVKAIFQLCKVLSKQDNFKIIFDYNLNEYECKNLDHLLSLNLYRITQEFINNTIKHAKASKLSVYLASDSHYLTLSLKDNGVGFNLREKINSGNGLQHFTSRVLAFSGKVKIESQKDIGTTLNVKVPLPYAYNNY